jgi:thiol-disulfide isomerase/thioredoxin
MTTKLFVQVISAPWCKRCVEIKPRVSELCRIVGATLEEVNFDELEEDDTLKASVTALPTIRLLVERDGKAGGWAAYTPKEFQSWENQMMLLAGAGPGDDMDF